MKDLDFNELVSSSVIDSWTATILWEYYVEWKYIDWRFTLWIVWIVVVIWIFMWFSSY